MEVPRRIWNLVYRSGLRSVIDAGNSARIQVLSGNCGAHCEALREMRRKRK